MTHSETSFTCEDIRDRIDPYIDGDLSPAETSDVALHLSDCVACLQELEIARSIAGTLRSMPLVECPDSVTVSVREHVRRTGSARARGAGIALVGSWWDTFWRPAIVGVAAVALLAVTAVVGRYSTTSPQYTVEEVAQAEADLRWALTYVGQVTRRTQTTVRDDVLRDRVAAPIRRAVQRSFSFPKIELNQEAQDAG